MVFLKLPSKCLVLGKEITRQPGQSKSVYGEIIYRWKFGSTEGNWSGTEWEIPAESTLPAWNQPGTAGLNPIWWYRMLFFIVTSLSIFSRFLCSSVVWADTQGSPIPTLNHFQLMSSPSHLHLIIQLKTLTYRVVSGLSAPTQKYSPSPQYHCPTKESLFPVVLGRKKAT